MKKALLTFLLIVVGSTTIIAQPQIKFGIRAGLNYTNTSVISEISVAIDHKYRFSYHTGIVSLVTLNDKISISPELLYSSKGYKSPAQANTNPSGDVYVHYNYLSVPILLNYHLTDKIYLSLGPEFNYMLSAKSKFDSGSIDLFDFWEEHNFDVNRFDFGISGGISIFLIDQLTISGRYFHGLSSVFKGVQQNDENGNPLDEDLKFLNQTFQLSVAYLLK
ncbi:MAG TPA: hypothetical protein DDY13_07290 [Cytophagales bacterium]|jgi:hypothetical protein|nr:hypothetical protein [Cytophagales bacterium]